MRKAIGVLLTVVVLCASCEVEKGHITRVIDSEVLIYPDYKNVVIPSNIAPMNFAVLGDVGDYALQIEAPSKTLWVRAKNNDFDIPLHEWHELLADAKGGRLTMTIATREKDDWVGTTPFEMRVVSDSIDEYITYRLIPPGYVGWYKMGIYQCSLSTSEQSVIFENTHTHANCVNCHTVGSQSSSRTLFHMRGECAGTYLMKEGEIARLDTKTDSTISAFVYPAWHPDGRYIAFSTNSTAQTFHTAHRDRIEVFDYSSDIIVYDTELNEVFYSPLLKASDCCETFPTFSPDGKWLYFCTSPEVKDVELNYSQVHYSLCRIAFDAERGGFGNIVDTLYNAEQTGRSVSFPRVSPDGRIVVFVLSNYGNFSIWHSDADLYSMSLDGERKLKILDEINSSDVESYHSWSKNGRWMVFSSRRDDGLYTRPYFAYYDEEGKWYKPFMLPQKSTSQFYKRLDMSYNVPEFMDGPSEFSMRDILNVAKEESKRVCLR